MKESYHSALWEEVDLEPVTECSFSGGEAFQWDISSGIPEKFSKCGAVYSEPPWRRGFEEFNKRAGVNPSGGYNDLLRSIQKACLEFGKPCFLVVSKADRKKYDKASGHFQIVFDSHGGSCICVCYNVEVPNFGDGMTTSSLLKWMTKKYGVIGDFCCGYGTTGQRVLKNGGEVALCDYNAKCIAVVASKMGLPS
jgi:hypothetical protein